jgi:hypothetical protein
MTAALAAAYARRKALVAAPDAAVQEERLVLRREHQKELSDLKSKHDAEIAAIRHELATARRELNVLRTHNEWYARKLKTYDGIAQLIAAAARTEQVRWQWSVEHPNDKSAAPH